jgi:hypothetical protein
LWTGGIPTTTTITASQVRSRRFYATARGGAEPRRDHTRLHPEPLDAWHPWPPMPLPPELLGPDEGDPCAGGRHTLVLVSYPTPQGREDAEGSSVPLRCGQPDQGGRDGWGYRHFATRFSGWSVAERFHRDIATTLEMGARERVNRGTVRYEHVWLAAGGGIERAMTVVVSLRRQRPDMGVRGIITAYWWQRPERAMRLLRQG